MLAHLPVVSILTAALLLLAACGGETPSTPIAEPHATTADGPADSAPAPPPAPRATCYVDLGRTGPHAFSPNPLHVPVDVPFLLVIRLAEPAEHGFRLALAGEFDTATFSGTASDRVVSGVLTLSPGRYALGCLNHLEERLEIIAGGEADAGGDGATPTPR